MSTTATAAAPADTSVGAAHLPDHLSWSGIKAYADCPRKFEFRYIHRTPEEFAPASLAFGGSFHRAAEILHHSRIAGEATPAVETLLAAYDAAWKEETRRVLEVRFAKGDDAISLRDMAQRMLAAYREYVMLADQSEATKIIAIEHAHLFRLMADVPPIEMRLDLLELRGTDLVVTDIKTSRCRWNDGKVFEHMPQLVLYSVGLMSLLRELGAQRIVPRFCVVSKAKTPLVQVLEPKAGQADVERLKHQVADTWEAIRKGVFVQRESWGCAQCPYRERCLGR
jgi:putative RecB family exonuclease